MLYCVDKMYFDKGKLLKYSISKCLKVFFCNNVLVKLYGFISFFVS